MASPVKPSDFSNLVLTSSATLCDRFKAVLLSLPSKLYDLANYILDADGNPSKGFVQDMMTNTGVWSAGDIKSTARGDTPDGWLECNGSAREQADFPDLYAAISTTYGNGDGNGTQFNLPDMRAHVLIGVNDGASQLAGYSTYGLGSAIGSETVIISEDQLPAHNHINPDSMGKKLWHDGQEGPDGKRVRHFGDGPSFAGISNVETVSKDTGGGQAVPVVQPGLVVRFLIYSNVYSSTA
jgi:microcystin-dependent protein